MKFFAGLSLATSALALSIERIEKRDSPLAVNIESVGNSAVKATIVNTGAEAVKVFKTGSLLDDIAVEKTQVFAGGKSFCRSSASTAHLVASKSVSTYNHLKNW